MTLHNAELYIMSVMVSSP